MQETNSNSREYIFALLSALVFFSLFLLSLGYEPKEHIEANMVKVDAKAESQTSVGASEKIVTIGYYINSIYNISIQNSSYTLDFYQWYRWACPHADVEIPSAELAEYEFSEEVEAIVRSGVLDEVGLRNLGLSATEIDTIKTIRQDIIQGKNSESLKPEFINTRDNPERQFIGAYENEKITLHDKQLCYESYRVISEFLTTFDLKKYPFDTQNLEVIIEDELLERDQLRYVWDHEDSGLEHGLKLNGWVVAGHSGREVSHIYDSTWGIPAQHLESGTPLKESSGCQGSDSDAQSNSTESSASCFSRLTISIDIEREVLSYLLKTLLTLTVIVAVTGLTFFLAAEDLAGRTGFCLTTLLSLIALQFTVSSGLPNIGYATATDNFFIIGYVLILLTTASVVWTSKFHERWPRLSHTINQKAGYYYPSVMFFLLACNIILTKYD